jgi:hypothetical protein
MTSAVVNFDWINHVFMRTNKNAGTGVILGLAFAAFAGLCITCQD